MCTVLIQVYLWIDFIVEGVMRRKTVTLASAFVVLVAGLMWPGAAGARDVEDAQRCDSHAFLVDAVEAGCTPEEGDVVVVEGMRFVVSAPGMNVSTASSVVDGAVPDSEITVGNVGDAGIIVVVDGELRGAAEARAIWFAKNSVRFDQDTQTGAASAIAAGKCASSSYVLTDSSWGSEVNWYYRSANEKVASVPTLEAAAESWTGYVNSDCSTPWSSADANWVALTTLAPGVTGGSCGTNDSRNVVGWGVLPSGTLARACWWWATGGITVAGDIMFNSSYSWANSSSVCTGAKYDLQGVATHEWGHVFGLNHDLDAGSQQVMKKSSTTCEVSQRKLGSGDVAGITWLY